MIRRPPRSTLDRSSAASDVYKRQGPGRGDRGERPVGAGVLQPADRHRQLGQGPDLQHAGPGHPRDAVSYTHLRAHETVLDLVCRLLLEKKKTDTTQYRHTLEHIVRQELLSN